MNDINYDPVILTKLLIKCPSITPKDMGALNIVQKHLEYIDFNCFNLNFSEAGTDDVKNLFASIGKSNGKHLAFAGHTDVVPIGDINSWKFHPFEGVVSNGKLYGRGSEDMKGGIACFISATKKFLDKHKKNFNGKISFIITGDEEKEAINGTIKILKWLKEKKIKIDHCIVGEPTSNKIIGDKLKIGRRGSINFYLKAKGVQGHTANSNRAENPVHLLIKFLNTIISEPLDNGNEFFLPSSIQIPTFNVNNTAANVIPEVATATINIRYNNKHNAESLQEWLQKHIDNYFSLTDKASCSFTIDKTGKSFLTKPGFLSKLVSECCREINGLNSNPELATDGGTSDARFIKDYCEVVELGLINKTLHQVNENVKTKDLEQLTNIYLKVLEKYFGLN
ncbi:MAG: Succinyl-diaminopimelate desuccinylase [Alphaproteobacteria bacterium MarineAlpha5_Bin9]|nr:MAG: Succinyl-diaminopimelate desuccinylase [Alphaproteobacteria bacterium MarineAlpha5_Bin9]|tara:strand:+ start:272 stop:1456 length:1185 start_codon:yes stop_codon:yes gene_type:complete